MPLDEQRDLELIALGAAMVNSSALKPAFEALSAETFQDKAIAAVIEEMKRGKREALQAWLKRRGATVNGKAVEAVLGELTSRARKREMSRVAEGLRLAISAGCAEEVRECLTRLAELEKR